MASPKQAQDRSPELSWGPVCAGVQIWKREPPQSSFGARPGRRFGLSAEVVIITTAARTKQVES
eukprot:3663691-Alexandrium_andersonii.AAC.1